MRRKHLLYGIILSILICALVVSFGFRCASSPQVKKQKLTVYEIAGAGSEGFSQVWEDGQAVR